MENLGLNSEHFFPGIQSHQKFDFEQNLRFQLIRHGRKRTRRGSSLPVVELKDKEASTFERDAIRQLNRKKPEYPDEMLKIIHKPIIQKGKPFDVISLLSSSSSETETDSNYLLHSTNSARVEVESLRGKYILLCCFFVPNFFVGGYSILPQSISLLSKEIEMSGRKDFEMVLVAKMRPQCSTDEAEAAFKHFISAFSCLVVPFNHSTRRDYICMSLNFDKPYKGLLVDPDQIVLQDNLHFVDTAGMNAFPFTDEMLSYARKVTRDTNSLEGLLGLNLDDFLFKNRSHDYETEKVQISELKNKVVGLYLCISGTDFPLLENIYKECLSRNLEFEIVLVNIPFSRNHTIEARQEAIASFLQERNLSWWVLPFNNSAFRMLHNRVTSDISDRLIIVTDKLVDTQGQLVIRHFGIDAYPFTRESVVRKTCENLTQHTLQSLFGRGLFYRRNDKNAPVSVADLQGKTILLCLHRWSRDVLLYEQFIKYCFDIKEEHPADFELVFVCLDTNLSLLDDENLSNMPWLVYHTDPYESEIVLKALSIGSMNSLEPVAFGEDGRICSIGVKQLLRMHGSAAFPFSGNLLQEVALELKMVVSDFLD